jgi:hypothetical protein
MANNSSKLSSIQIKNNADGSDQVVAYSSVSSNDVLIAVSNLYTNSILMANQVLVMQSNTPTHSNSFINNIPMTFWYDSSYLYVATTANTVLRAALSTF